MLLSPFIAARLVRRKISVFKKSYHTNPFVAYTYNFTLLYFTLCTFVKVYGLLTKSAI